MWSLVGVFAVISVMFVVWHTHSSHQAIVVTANDRISEAVASANEWIAGSSPLDGKVVEQRLVNALQSNAATERTHGEVSLAQVRQRQQQLVKQARIEQAQLKATSILEDAKARLDTEEVSDAVALLRIYLVHPHGTEKATAQRLLAEVETALSDTLTLDALVAMSVEEFDLVKSEGEIVDGKVSHPMLISVRKETVKRNLNKAFQLREQRRIAEEERREDERLSRGIEATPVKGFPGVFVAELTFGKIEITLPAPVIWIMRGYPTFAARDFCRLQLIVGGNVYDEDHGVLNINGKPVAVSYITDQIHYSIEAKTRFGNWYTFEEPGKTHITIEIGDQRVRVPFEIRELIYSKGTDSAKILQDLGFPSSRKTHYTSWPHTKSYDGLIYSPSAVQGSIVAEHWTFDSLPYAIIAIVNDRLDDVGSYAERHRRYTARPRR
jgi:hypothetical protein